MFFAVCMLLIIIVIFTFYRNSDECSFYSDTLKEMISLLKKSNNIHWTHWFQIALDLYESSRALSSYAKKHL